MKVREFANFCNTFAPLDISATVFGSATATVANAKTFVACCNLVNEELCCDYATVVRRAVLTAADGVASTDGLRLHSVLSIADGSGAEVNYRYTQGGLALKDGKYTVTYTVLPEELSWDDEIVLPSPKITPRIFAYGVLFEYFASLGNFTAAKSWESRFRDALRAAQIKKSSIVMPARRWA